MKEEEEEAGVRGETIRTDHHLETIRIGRRLETIRTGPLLETIRTGPRLETLIGTRVTLVPSLIEVTLAETCGVMTEVSVVTIGALAGMVATGGASATEGMTETCHVLAIETLKEPTDVSITLKAPLNLFISVGDENIFCNATL